LVKSRLAIAVSLWGWTIFIAWLSYDYVEYQARWLIHIFYPAEIYEIHAFHVLIILIPFIYTLLGYLVNEREKLLEKIKDSEEKFRKLSLHDKLTGLHNRRGFDFLAEQQLKIVNRTKKGMFLLFVDVDNLKWINDNFGHQEGDKVLIDTANILKRHIRTSDVLSRIGGDEFAALIDKTHEDLSEILTQRLEETVRIYNAEETRSYKLSLSIGFAHYNPATPCSIKDLLNHADKNMYEQKDMVKTFHPNKRTT
jgi:diguanylate cyclase (GGDEF)-like protein